MNKSHPTTTEAQGEDLEDIRRKFGLDGRDTEYYKIEEVK